MAFANRSSFYSNETKFSAQSTSLSLQPVDTAGLFAHE